MSKTVIFWVVLQNLVVGRRNANFYNSMCKRPLPNAGLPFFVWIEIGIARIAIKTGPIRSLS